MRTTLKSPNGYQQLVLSLIAHVFTSLLIPVFRRLYDRAAAQTHLAALGQLPPGTLGRDVADMLLTRGLELIPHYESHDLKHALLGYDMTPVDEMNLKAFMLGNGDRTISSLGLMMLGLFMPERWASLRGHYRRGRRTQSIMDWQLADYAEHGTAALRQQIGLPANEPGHVGA